MRADCNAPARPGVRNRRGGREPTLDHSALPRRARGRAASTRSSTGSMRALLQPFSHLYWRLSRIGREHVPRDRPGDLRLQPPLVPRPLHHRPDARRRPVYYVAKEELFKHRLFALVHQLARRLPGPPRRGRRRHGRDRQGDPRARRRPVLIFPEGTRTRPGALGKPKRGVGRLALETGATVVPVAMIGTEAIRKGWRIRPHKIRIRIGAPLSFPHVEQSTGPLAAARHRPHLAERDAPVGVARRPAAAAPRRRHRRRLLGHRGRRHARPRRHRGRPRLPHARAGRPVAGQRARTSATCPASSCPSACIPCARPSSSSSATTSSPSPSPRPSCPPRSPSTRPSIAPRTGVLVLSKGLVPPLGTLPSAYVAERTRAWAVGVARRARPRARRARRRRLARARRRRTRSFARQVGDALAAAGLDVTQHDRRDRRRARRLRQERRRARRRRGRRRRPERRGRRRRQGLRRDRRVRAPLRLQAGDVRRPGRHRRPRRHRARRGLAQPPRGRAAGAGHAGGRDRRRRSGRPPRRSPPCRCSPRAWPQAGVDAPVLRGLAGIIEGSVEPERWTHSLTAPKPPARPQRRGSLAAGARPGIVSVTDVRRTRLRAQGQGDARRRLRGRSTRRTCATSTRTRTTGWATTTTPRT